MYNDTLTGIVEWNLVRNGLKFDPNLEAKMLSEEAREFFTASSLVERCREAADFDFVLVGTMAKYSAQEFKDVAELTFSQTHFEALKAWAEGTRERIRGVLGVEFAALGVDPERVDGILEQCIKFVLEANESKGTQKNAEGKVEKGSNYVSPSVNITQYLNAIL